MRISRPVRNTFLGGALCLILAAFHTCSSKADEPRAVQGAGNVSCGEWQEFRTAKDGRTLQVQAWVEGFLSGYNMLSDHDILLGHTANVALFAWMDNYCASHPLDAVVQGALRLKEDLSNRTSR